METQDSDQRVRVALNFARTKKRKRQNINQRRDERREQRKGESMEREEEEERRSSDRIRAYRTLCLFCLW